MPLLNAADNIKLGELQASRVYLGPDIVWPSISTDVSVAGFEVVVQLGALAGWLAPVPGEPDDGDKWTPVPGGGTDTWTPIVPGPDIWIPVKPEG